VKHDEEFHRLREALANQPGGRYSVRFLWEGLGCRIFFGFWPSTTGPGLWKKPDDFARTPQQQQPGNQ